MAIQLTRNTIINLLKAEKSYLTKEFGVVNIGLFGSFATGQSDRDSDIDLIVELREPRFDHLAVPAGSGRHRQLQSHSRSTEGKSNARRYLRPHA